ncbi:MAG: hypothetical protein SGPRY_014578, partial [Prymnesium sp.]
EPSPCSGGFQRAKPALGLYPHPTPLYPSDEAISKVARAPLASTLEEMISSQRTSHQPHVISRMLRTLGLPPHITCLTPPHASLGEGGGERGGAQGKGSQTPYAQLRAEQNHVWAAQNVRRFDLATCNLSPSGAFLNPLKT